MYATQQPWADLYEALRDHDGPDAYAAILEPWPAHNPDECRWLADLSQRTDNRGQAVDDEEVCRLYAIFRVASLMLLRFQSGNVDESAYAGPAVTVEQYWRFFETLGFHVPVAERFHPFFHEILGVRQSPVAHEPVTIVAQAWPPLMLCNLMFCRAGVVVAGGTDHVVKAIAEHSRLYWTFRRNDRPCSDLSHGWGHNSQWRTGLRRDYRSAQGFHYNVDGEDSLDGAGGPIDGLDAATMIELVRYRGFVRSAADDSDLYPYRWSFVEAVDGNGA
ncbi:MAG TPA: hypothetical protein VM555_07760 [Tahibacter sp.]|nr:hypothetical protein [Tahibacter sp.]